MMNFNIQSIQYKVDQLEYFMNNEAIDIACITEHWLRAELLERISIQNFTICAAFCRSTHLHGGVLIALRSNIDFKKCQEITSLSIEKVVEMTSVILTTEQVIILAVYRIPGSCFDTFIAQLSAAMEMLQGLHGDGELFIMGDFNINFQKETTERNTLVNMFRSFGLEPLFSNPSRIASDSSTCIDNVIANVTSVSIRAKQTRDLFLSDHCAQVVAVDCDRRVNTGKRRSRKINESTILMLREKLGAVRWPDFGSVTGDEAFSIFHDAFMEAYNTSCPEIEQKVQQNKKYKQCSDLHREWNILEALKIISVVRKDQESKDIFKRFKNMYFQEVVNKKRRSNANYIASQQNKQRAIWRVINNNTRQPKFYQSSTTDITAEDLNGFFSSIGESTKQSIPAAKTTIMHYMASLPRQGCSFCLTPVTEREICGVIGRIRCGDALDVYGCNTRLLKHIVGEIKDPLVQLINKSFEEGIFPQELKKAKITPIPKKADATQCDHFRPVSILPIFSKIFELCMKDRLVLYFEKKVGLSSDQHGFREGRSTSTAMLELLDYVTAAFDQKEEVSASLCDLSRAFDLVPHNLLIQKLEYYGIRGNMLNLIKSYLEDRTQRVHFRDQQSTTSSTTMGIPQGSILGPLLFIIYTNDLPINVNSSGLTLQFADDTTFLTKAKTLVDAEELGREALDDAQEWFNSNQLKINRDKTAVMPITTRRRHDDTTVRFLGLTIDSKLNWKQHVTELKKKLSSAIYCIRRMRQVATQECALACYYSNFYSQMAYGVLMWGASTEAESVFVLQKRSLRALFGMEPRESCRGGFERHRMLTLPALYVLRAVEYVHKNKHKFSKNAEVHQYPTRQGEQLRIGQHRLTTTQNTVMYRGPMLYNCLPDHLKSLPVARFTREVGNLLKNKALYSIEEFFY